MKPGVDGVRTCDPVTGEWEVTAQFTVVGKKFAPVSLVPLLGLALLIGIVLLIGSSSFH